MALIAIEIISDPICPWCFIGYRSLQRAISLYQKTYPGGSNDQFRIVWRPYFIDQVAPVESVLIYDRMSRRMTDAQITAAQTRLTRTGSSVGICFQFRGYIGSSRLAHRALFFAEQQGEEGNEIQSRLAETLFKYQFELERDISDVDAVVKAAAEVGFDEDEVRAYLAGDGGIEEVERDAKQAREKGVQGVPHFVIGGEHHFDGAGDFSEFFEAFVALRGKPIGCS